LFKAPSLTAVELDPENGTDFTFTVSTDDRMSFALKWGEVAGGCRKLHHEELHNLYCSHKIIRVIK
jgi:hypothetical protein